MVMFNRLMMSAFLCVGVAWADAVPEALQNAADKFAKSSAFRARIAQTNFVKMSESEEVYKGNIFFDRDKLLIRYSSPSEQLVYSDKQKTVVYLEESNQKIVSSPTLIFWPNKMIAKFLDGGKDFVSEKRASDIIYSFVPDLEKSENVAKVEIGISDKFIASVKYYDFEGNSTCYEFFDLQSVESLDASLFEIAYPEDVEVIDNR